jgi:hypothetical protein
LEQYRFKRCTGPLQLLAGLAAGCALLASAPARGQVAGPHKFTVRDDRKLLRDGVPFFPIGLYYAGEDLNDASGRGLAEIRRMGFNTVFFNGGPNDRVTLDRIAAAGLHVQFRPAGSLNHDFEKLARLVTALRSHPALLFWEVEDEPLLNRVNFKETLRGYEMVKRLDPDHPILCVQFPDWKRTDELAAWSTLCDVYGFDMYPLPLKRWYYQGENIREGFPFSIAVMGHLTEWWRALSQNKPVLPVLQAWAWAPVADGPDGYPTRQQSRFMAYQVVIRGAMGILYYGQVHVTTRNPAASLPETKDTNPADADRNFRRAKSLNDWFWSYHKDVVKEVAQMAPVFTARDIPLKPQLELIGATSARRDEIEARIKRGRKGNPVILMVNASEHAASIRLVVPVFARGRVHCWHENRQIQPDASGAFVDRLEPYAVRVYSNASQEEWLRSEGVDAPRLASPAPVNR